MLKVHLVTQRVNWWSITASEFGVTSVKIKKEILFSRVSRKAVPFLNKTRRRSVNEKVNCTIASITWQTSLQLIFVRSKPQKPVSGNYTMACARYRLSVSWFVIVVSMGADTTLRIRHFDNIYHWVKRSGFVPVFLFTCTVNASY